MEDHQTLPERKCLGKLCIDTQRQQCEVDNMPERKAHHRNKDTRSAY